MRHGSNLDPPNRFETVRREIDFDHLEWDAEYLHARENRRIDYIFHASKSIISENDSPDIPFRYSLNPYRGCIHGCAYCYARNTHEYLGYNAGLDFETKIIVKQEAPKLFREFLSKPAWQPEWIAFSGVTDCYQPAEREFRLTRGCLEVALEFGQPVGIVTKNALVARDLDLLVPLAERSLVHVYVSVTTLDPELARVMEPRTSVPLARLRAIKMLSDANVPVGVMVAPLIPGLNDHEAPAILKEARTQGAKDARYTLLRLPITVEPVFREWLHRERPNQAEKVENLIRQTRRGKLNESQWGERMQGQGEVAEQIRSMFNIFRQKLGFDSLPKLDNTQFRRPQPKSGQLTLF